MPSFLSLVLILWPARSTVVVTAFQTTQTATTISHQQQHHPRRRNHSLIGSFPRRNKVQLNVWLSNQAALSAIGPDAYELTEEDHQEDDDDKKKMAILSYLPRSVTGMLPPLTLDLLHMITESYIDGDLCTQEPEQVLRKEIQNVMVKEHQIRNVPVEIGEVRIETDRSEEEQMFSKTLSLAALYRLPKEITLDLLSSVCKEQSDRVESCIEAFSDKGWNVVSFPKGLLVGFLPEFVPTEDRPSKTSRLFRSRKRRREEARRAVSEASETRAPRKRLQSREEFLARMEQQLSDIPTSVSKEQALADGLLFFPNSVPQPRFSLKRLKQVSKQKYAVLKQKGRAGFLSYCFFNFLFYTIGILWQWRRIAPGDPIASSSTALMIVGRKFGRVFASLYVASQVFKLPKLFGAVALVPVTERLLRSASRKLRVNETVASILFVVLLYATWLGLVGIPVLAEYAKLRQLIHMDEHLLQQLQPV